MERIDIYDENRKKTDKIVERNDIKLEGEYDLSVQIWIMNNKEEIILTKRANKSTYPYLWECTEGIVETGETSLEAAIREVKEEIGINVYPEEIVKLKIDKEKENPKFTDVYLCRKNILLEDIILQKEECSDVKIVNEQEYNQMVKNNEIIPYLDYFYDMYRKNKEVINEQEKIFIYKNKKYLKGNLHTHSTQSDGIYDVDEILDIYENNGYDFLGITDHDKFSRYTTNKNIILLNGIEVSCMYKGNKEEKGPYVHCCCFLRNENVEDVILNYKNVDELQTDINELNKKYNLLQFNHPLFSRLSDNEMLKLNGYNLIEIYNHKDFLKETGELNSEHLIRTLLNNNKKFYITANDDFHGPYKKTTYDNCFGGYIFVNAEKNSENILNAIKTGDFYASTGPEIFEYKICGRKIKITTSPAQRIIFYSNMRNCKNIFSDDGDEITEGEYILKGEEFYVWAKVIDKKGNTAWTQPIFFDNNPYFD